MDFYTSMRTNVCKYCHRQKTKSIRDKYPHIMKEWVEKNREKIKARAKAYKIKNAERIKIKTKQYKEANKLKIKKQKKDWIDKNREKTRMYAIKSNQKHKDRVLAKSKTTQARRRAAEYIKNRKKTDIDFHIKTALRVRIRSVCRAKGVRKTTKHNELLGCSVTQFRQHLQSKFTDKMSWENYGSYWEIDHIIPCASFNLLNEEDQKKCFNYKNTQPLTISENRRKSKKLIYDGF